VVDGLAQERHTIAVGLEGRTKSVNLRSWVGNVTH
jgi:hypothetical protein